MEAIRPVSLVRFVLVGTRAQCDGSDRRFASVARAIEKTGLELSMTG